MGVNLQWGDSGRIHIIITRSRFGGVFEIATDLVWDGGELFPLPANAVVAAVADELSIVLDRFNDAMRVARPFD